jgi:putative pyruvate formate lyase activating enzyme
MTIDIESNVSKLFELISPCRLCPHNCKVKRLAGERGRCRTADEIYVASANIHNSEEPPISGTRGSGTIFFANCSLSCVFCQNYPISQMGNANLYTSKQLVDAMLVLQAKGAHNINFVTPTHYSAHMAKAVVTARKEGLTIPVLSNSSGYENVETLKLLEGIIDIYMPDAKYSDNNHAEKYSNAPGYWEANQKALLEMHRQVGELTFDKNGIAVKGLLIRHLVLPDRISGSKKVLTFIAESISNQTYLSLMSQYHPANKTKDFPELSRRLTEDEYNEVRDYAQKLGFVNGWQQEL